MINIVKPQIPIINWSHPLSRGLVAVFAATEKRGSLLNLVDRRTQLSLINSGAWTTGPIGPQLNCSQATDSGAWNTTPPSAMMPAKQVSLFWQGSLLGSATASAQIAGMTYTNADTTPFVGYNFQYPGTPVTDLELDFNTDGTFQFLQFTPTIAMNGTERQYLGTIITGSQAIYENGVLVKTGALTYTNITYGASPQFGLGIYQNGSARNSKSKCSLCYVWNRVLSQQEARMLYVDPLQIFKKPNFLNLFNSNLGFMWQQLIQMQNPVFERDEVVGY